MTRFAGSQKSKSDDEFGPKFHLPGLAPQQPPDLDYLAPRPVAMSLADAMQMVAAGRMEPMDVFLQLPLPLVTSLNEAARQVGGRDFSALSPEQQKMIFAALTDAVKCPPVAPPPSCTTRRGPPATSASTGRKWWQFWRA